MERRREGQTCRQTELGFHKHNRLQKKNNRRFPPKKATAATTRRRFSAEPARARLRTRAAVFQLGCKRRRDQTLNSATVRSTSLIEGLKLSHVTGTARSCSAATISGQKDATTTTTPRSLGSRTTARCAKRHHSSNLEK